MVLAIVALGLLAGAFSAGFALFKGYSVLMALALYSGAGVLSILAATGLVIALSEFKRRPLPAQNTSPPHRGQADAAV